MLKEQRVYLKARNTKYKHRKKADGQCVRQQGITMGEYNVYHDEESAKDYEFSENYKEIL